jgi:hypothetical protein
MSEHMWMDHEPDDVACPHDPAHTAALQRRRGAVLLGWGPLQLGQDGGGWRHFLDGEPIHCGSGLELQAVTYQSGRLRGVHRQAGHGRARPVRDRVAAPRGAARRLPWRAVLYVDVGGHTFTAPAEAWMRFRWPAREGR